MKKLITLAMVLILALTVDVMAKGKNCKGKKDGKQMESSSINETRRQEFRQKRAQRRAQNQTNQTNQTNQGEI